MEDKFKKLTEMISLYKGYLMPSLRMPSNEAPKAPKAPSMAAQPKKNPVDVAQQIKAPEAKDYAMQQAKNQVKARSNQLAFGIKKSEGESRKFHIVNNGYRVTSEPVTIEHVNNMYGGVKKLEQSGHLLVPVVEEKLHQHPKTGQWSLKRV